MFGSIAAGFVTTPLFVVNSKYDTWQEEAIIGANVRSHAWHSYHASICHLACL